MAKDILFLLAPGFEAAHRREFCLECAAIWGVLGYYPAIKETLEIRYETLAHPRAGLISLLGDGEWNCPALVLDDAVEVGPDADVKIANRKRFLDNARDIAKYFAFRYGTAFPRGS